MDGENGINVDGLAVGLTRPSTVLGVPYTAAVLNLIVSIEAVIWTQKLQWFLVCVPVHGIFALITLHDPRAFEVLALWMRTSLGTLIATRWYWSASSYSPLAFRQRFGLMKRRLVRRRLERELWK